MQDSVTQIREFVSGKRQTRQGYGQVPQQTVMSQLQQANMAIGSKPVVPAQPEILQVEMAEQRIAEAVERIDGFMKKSWPGYRSLVEGTKQNLFKNQP
jgi:hypothetical protein